jgi:versiconal hemiacetal acetate esterase
MKACLEEAEVLVKLDYYEGLPHYFWSVPTLPEREGYINKLLAGVRWIVDQM